MMRWLRVFVHVFVVQVDGIANARNVPCCAWLGQFVTVDVALHFECPFFALLASPECLGHIAGLAANLDASVSDAICEGRHACAVWLSC